MRRLLILSGHWKGGRDLTIKIRLTGDSEQEVLDAIEICEQLLPNCVITSPRQGRNPKYADDPKWLAYGEMQRAQPRQRRSTRRPSPVAPASKPLKEHEA